MALANDNVPRRPALVALLAYVASIVVSAYAWSYFSEFIPALILAPSRAFPFESLEANYVLFRFMCMLMLSAIPLLVSFMVSWQAKRVSRMVPIMILIGGCGLFSYIGWRFIFGDVFAVIWAAAYMILLSLSLLLLRSLAAIGHIAKLRRG